MRAGNAAQLTLNKTGAKRHRKNQGFSHRSTEPRCVFSICRVLRCGADVAVENRTVRCGAVWCGAVRCGFLFLTILRCGSMRFLSKTKLYGTEKKMKKRKASCLHRSKVLDSKDHKAWPRLHFFKAQNVRFGADFIFQNRCGADFDFKESYSAVRCGFVKGNIIRYGTVR